MSTNDDDILARELGKIGELGGTLGGLLPKAAGIGAFLGARFAASFLPTETYAEKVPLAIGTEKALELGFSVLTKLGVMQQTETNTNAPYPLLRAVVKSGFLNMNPAIVYLEILQGDAASCEITITAAAKEGLIKQRTSEKAVRRVTSEIKQRI
jgi:hypothetical protein